MTLLPETAAYLAAAKAVEAPKIHTLDPATARAVPPPAARGIDTVLEPLAAVETLAIPAPHGPLAAELYVPEAGNSAGPCIVYYHGGGWVIGSVEDLAATCSRIANRTGLRVVSVDYRLAPEAKFPAPVEDAITAARWIAGSPAALGAAVTGIVTAGDSAGANLAIAVAGSGAVAVMAQLLFYPVTDLSRRHPSYGDFAEGYMLEAEGMEWFARHYLSDPAERTDPRVSPLLAEDMSVFPPTVLMTAEYDVLRDEGRAFAARLVAAGVRVKFSEGKGVIHGVVNKRGVLPVSAIAIDRAIDDLAGLLREIG